MRRRTGTKKSAEFASVASPEVGAESYCQASRLILVVLSCQVAWLEDASRVAMGQL